MIELDSSLDFVLKSAGPRQFFLSGKYQLCVGERLVVGIPGNALLQPPEGFIASESGFYFFYLSGTGSVEEFSRTFSVETDVTELPMFLRRWYSEGEIFVDIDQVDWSAYVFVLGSCVSRDMFEFAEVPLAGYRARSSFGSIASLGFTVDEEALKVNQSDFQRRMVRGDLEKTNVALAHRSPGKAILVDLIDERLPLMESDRRLYTDSPELRATSLSLGGRRIDPYSTEYFERFEEGWKQFDAGVPTKTILLNRVHWSTKKEDGSHFPHLDEIARQNERLDRLYAIIETVCPRAIMIGPFPDQTFSSLSHKWGENPYHYCDELYKRVARGVEAVVEDKERPVQ